MLQGLKDQSLEFTIDLMTGSNARTRVKNKNADLHC